MGSDKSFNDARVLRSNDVSLTVKQLKMLLSNLENGEHNLADLRKLDSIDKKITEVLGDYAESIDKLSEFTGDVAREHGVESPEFRDANKLYSDYVRDNGDELASDVIITTSEWDWIKTRWNSNSKLIGNRAVRSDILAIDDVINNAKGVKFTKDKQVWVQGEPEPFPVQESSA